MNGATHIAISGASGLLGAAVARLAGERGCVVHPMVRRGARPGTTGILWDPEKGVLDPERLGEVGAVVHLAAESLAAGRWSAARKERILASRVHGTRLIAERMALARPRPRALISASAVGWYGDRGDETLTEATGPGSGFLAEVCREWEAATEPARRAGIRVVCVRSGLVLAAHGGALRKMLLPFRLGLGGPLGGGRQWWSWISLRDEARAILHAVETESLEGPLNLVSPHPATNGEFTVALGRALSRPASLPVPAWLLRAALGEMSTTVLMSTRALPARIIESGFEFEDVKLEETLGSMLG